ncbi:hypothetical protein K466DRAFT_666045 [Polyporus arcularius HHB13444]|uniref:Uncharacterized protein n=1 Tax=Polyporus arcularius HHB13444 TaxID=1314778 RepID=A0A5C3P0W3_9APHY|nr:hypothetical protein K466DRAFT_666045 [Polyporus arcularius HHB13444]
MATSAGLWPRGVPTYLNVSEAAVANLSQTLLVTQQQVLQGFDYSGIYLKASLIDVTILTMFFGLFTVLTAVAAYILSLKGLTQKSMAVMLAAIIAMWISTAAYWLATLLAAVETYSFMRSIMSQILARIDTLQDCVGSPSGSRLPFSACVAEQLTNLSDYSKAYATQQCTGTAALTVNVIIGDAIVWWRAWVLWKDHRLVLCTWVILLLATMMTGIIDTKDACMPEAALFSITSPFAPDTSEVSTIGSLFGADGWGIAAAMLSLLTNMVATLLIAYRAWEHRVLIMSHLKGCSTRSQVERTLALLVESGVLYCALWVIIVVYQFVALKLGESAFAYGFYYVMGGCLIPLIGMYPTLIIILCALDKSLHEKSHNDARMSSPRFAVPVGHAHLSGLSSVSSASADTEAREAPSGVKFKEHAKVETGETASLSLAALANLSQTLGNTESRVSHVSTYEASNLRASMISLALLTMFLGLFTVLTVVAAYMLFSKGIKRKATAIMLVAIIVMWLSTVAYWIVTLVAAVKAYIVLWDLTAQTLGQIRNMQTCLYSMTSTGATYGCSPQDLPTEFANTEVYAAEDCTGIVSLAINMVIGDSIVWWRAWVLWPDSRVVRWGGVSMIVLTTITGAMNVSYTCRAQQWIYLLNTFNIPGPSPENVGFRKGDAVSGVAWGTVFEMLSFLTNVIATTLIAYRVWEHRRIIASYLKGSSPRSQVERTLALLVESGLLYCVLWVFIMVYELGYVTPGLSQSAYSNGFYYVMSGCIVPLIGMYPTLIIIVCAVNKSLHEKSTEDNVPNQNASIVFNNASPSRRRGTLSELLSATSTYHDAVSEEVAGPS